MKGSEQMLLEARGKETLIMWLPVVTQDIDNVPNSHCDLTKEISRRNIESATCLLLLPMMQ